ncbi:GTP cyclohydrolase 1 type 2-like protein [Candidatus Clavichlamydia salmonicola]|uniref:Nif3-like dinuclear metal center hexameric protein n=1 Tax=Candidatus Clavichlamydia salmonicola TaxID=469812 RepID=UPI00189183DC|nr:Nif3-like dinuclear metal center hexameric protein [Candidatus Clavichlamydia salmonicola]MBF5051124.1 GTP cyclohydrolase 1 type 2-like protein [Candidatus Clavichlamydia salmonicola]
MLTYELLEAYLVHCFSPYTTLDYCPNGLQVQGKKEIKIFATAVTADQATIERAIENNVDALIVHHGLFWKGDPYPLIGHKRQRIALLLKHNISLLAFHLPLDAHQDIGNNWKVAKDLRWSNLKVFSEIGVQGTFPSCPREDFEKKLNDYYGVSTKAAVLGGAKIVSSAALISGGAYKEIGNAINAKVDCFITGNFDEPVWSIAYEENINFFAMGHTATEKIGPKALAAAIKKDLGLEGHFIDTLNLF